MLLSAWFIYTNRAKTNHWFSYDLLSRSVKGKDRELYKQIYYDRIKYKYGNEAEKQLSSAYKLVLNVTYGAMKSVYNKLYDPLNANLVCIFGQLLILDLVEQLEKELSCEFIQLICLAEVKQPYPMQKGVI